MDKNTRVRNAMGYTGTVINTAGLDVLVRWDGEGETWVGVGELTAVSEHGEG